MYIILYKASDQIFLASQEHEDRRKHRTDLAKVHTAWFLQAATTCVHSASGGRGAYFGERATASWSLIMCQVSGTACMHMTLL